MLIRDESILNNILCYCNFIYKIMNRVKNDFEVFNNDFEAQQSVCFNILQIGENVKKLSNETKEKYNKVPWDKIVGMRNFVAHDYGSINIKLVFNSTQIDIPELQVYCLFILNKEKARNND